MRSYLSEVIFQNPHSTFQTKIITTSSMKQISTFKRAGLQWFSPNKHTLQFFSNQPQIACYNGWLQQVL